MLLAKANALYREGRFEAAADAYRKAEKALPELGEVIGRSIERCRRAASGDETSYTATASPPPGKAEEIATATRPVWPSAFLRPGAITPETNLRWAFEQWLGGQPIYFPPVEEPLVSVIIPVFKGRADLENCLRSLSATVHCEPSFEVILLDDCPEERVLWAIPQSGGMLKLINEKNLGFVLNCNKGASFARGKYLCFLNSDTLVSTGWLGSLVECLTEEADAGLCGSMLLGTNGLLQEAGWHMQRNGWGSPIGRGKSPVDGQFTYRRQVDCVTGASFLITRALFERLEGFDRSLAPAFYEEFDLAFRARELGYKTFYEPRSRVVHLGSASYGPKLRDELSARNHKKFVARFEEVLEHFPSNIDATSGWDCSQGLMVVVDLDVPQPNRHAGDVTMFRYLQLLADMRGQIVYAPFNGTADGPDADELEKMGIMLVRQPVTIADWFTRFGHCVTQVLVARPHVAQQVVPIIRAHSSAKIAYYTHDLHFVRMEKEAARTGGEQQRIQAQEMKQMELAVFQSVDTVLSPSWPEANQIVAAAGHRDVHVLPPYFYNEHEIITYDAEHFQPLRDIVFVGGFPHTPNVDAALFAVNEIMPLVWAKCPDTKLYLVGYAPPEQIVALASERVIVTGQVPRVEPYLENARMMLAPLRYGAGVKGKTIEALRTGVPIVGTMIAVEGINIHDGETALVADDAATLATHILRLLDDPQKCATLSHAGADLIRNEYSYENSQRLLGRLFPSE